MRLKISIIVIVSLLLGAGLVSVSAQTVNTDVSKKISDSIKGLQVLPEAISNIKSPDLENPAWLFDRIVAYSVATRGNIVADLAEFRSQANQTLNDARGWSRLGVSFQEVAIGGDFTLVLSEAGQVDSFTGFSGACSADWSCSVGNSVIINQDRWLGASYAWNQAGGSLRDYRNMVINHETGHWLGHNHLSCGETGQVAPLMQQQSIDLQGCSFNPWPLASEFWSDRLGV